MKMPHDIGPVHFVGIGGIGMSGIAEVLHQSRLQRAGLRRSPTAPMSSACATAASPWPSATRREPRRGARGGRLLRGQARQPRAVAARERQLPVVRRAEMLAELMRLKQAVAIGGTHGKTTTTSMVAALLDAGGFDPTVINGGIINAYGTNAAWARATGWWWRPTNPTAPSCKLPADVAIVTNIDPEHLDHYGTFDAVRDAFRQFVENMPFYGFAVMCIDHPEVQALVGRIDDRRIITYGVSPQADVRASISARDGRPVDVQRRDPRPRQRARPARSRTCRSADAGRAQRAERDRRHRRRP